MDLQHVGAIAVHLCWEIALKPRNRPNVGLRWLKHANRSPYVSVSANC